MKTGFFNTVISFNKRCFPQQITSSQKLQTTIETFMCWITWTVWALEGRVCALAVLWVPAVPAWVAVEWGRMYEGRVVPLVGPPAVWNLFLIGDGLTSLRVLMLCSGDVRTMMTLKLLSQRRKFVHYLKCSGIWRRNGRMKVNVYDVKIVWYYN